MSGHRGECICYDHTYVDYRRICVLLFAMLVVLHHGCTTYITLHLFLL